MEKCQKCGKKRKLIIHHVVYVPEEVISICRSCHSKIHPVGSGTGIGKLFSFSADGIKRRKVYNKENKASIKERCRKYHEKHRERIKAVHREYYLKHKQEVI